MLLSGKLFTSDPSSVISKIDVIYGEVNGIQLKLDLHSPEKFGNYPGILILHGGGWLGGSKKQFTNMSKELAARGYVVANADYRFASEARFPGAVSDAKTAVRWMRAHAKDLNLNSDLIIGAGFSAGGHLISMLGTTGDSGKFEGEAGWSEFSSALQGAFVMGAGVDQVARVEAAKGRTIKNCVIFFGGELDEKREIYEQGSPITHVDIKTAPFFFYDGEFDRPGVRYVKMREKMDQYKVPHYFEMLPKLKHGAWNKPEFRPQVVNKIDEFIKKLK